MGCQTKKYFAQILRNKSEQKRVFVTYLLETLLNVTLYCNRRPKKAETDAATIDPTTGQATVAEEVPGAGAGDSMVAAVAELTNTAETKRATKKLLTFLISIIIIIYLFILDDGFVCVFYLMP